MPSNENPTYNSSRMQRAYRINNIEHTRLQGKLNLLEKEKLHAVRVTNQDIRLISLTLDYINSCSGHSPEGLAPKEEMVQEKEDEGPFFMYGQRIISRKRRRIKRPQSAMFSGTRRRKSDSDFSASLASVQIRPQSSPVRRGLNGPIKDSDAESCISDVTLSSSSGSTSSSKPAWMDQTNALTKKLLKAKEGVPVFKRGLHERQRKIRRHSAGFDLSSLTVQLQALETPESNQKDNTHSGGLRRNAGISEILNQRQPTLSASAWKNQLIQNRLSSAPMSVSAKRQSIHELKVKINEGRQEYVQNKVKTFISQRTDE
ncbi:unnamed protein product [Mytilus coruscus]|uniref:Uncharacterized protein n=1 Tax=Mytilus coruscus TaxID=42192 RepID=A0A6J8AR01_MYTCO|nr:unnamed protein product [Mytilus coruscus]